jgi:hypothetical protein
MSEAANIDEELKQSNIPNGLFGMLRDVCILLTKYFKNEKDIIEVCFILFFIFTFLF